MASNTPNIGLYKVNPATDGNLTFNIETMLNDNWDKIDAEIGNMPKKDGTLQTGLNAEKVGGKTVSELAPASHTHTKSQITDISTANVDTVDGKHAATTLNTTEKNDLAGAINEVKSSVDTHLANFVTDTNGVHGLKFESGIWTPVLIGMDVAGNNTYLVQLGRYTKINNRVFIEARVQLSAKDSNMAGGLKISGLPFVSASIANYRAGFTIGVLNEVNYDIYKQITVAISDNQTTISLNKTGNNISQTALLPADIGSGFYIVVSGSYLTN